MLRPRASLRAPTPGRAATAPCARRTGASSPRRARRAATRKAPGRRWKPRDEPSAEPLVDLGTKIGVALALLQTRDLGHAGGHETRVLDELLALELAVAQRDLAHVEAHALALKV